MLIICNHRLSIYLSPIPFHIYNIIQLQLSTMKSNTILACSLIVSGIVAATEWETTYARYHHRNLSKAGKGESIGSKSTKSPTITSSGSKSSKGSGSKESRSKSSKSSGQTLTLEVSNIICTHHDDILFAIHKSNIYLSLSFSSLHLHLPSTRFLLDLRLSLPPIRLHQPSTHFLQMMNHVISPVLE